MTRPNFFIVGAPKCGTTAMNDYLQQHPQVFMAEKELHYWGSDLPLRNRISQQAYLEKFAAAGDRPVVGEASVWYLYSEKAAAEIKAFAPDARILILLRHPVAVLQSLHSQHVFDGNENEPSFENAIALEEAQADGKRQTNAVDYTHLPSYFRTVAYTEQVARFFASFGRDRVQVIIYDDFAQDSEGAVNQTLQALGLAPLPASVFKVVNPNKKVRWFWLHRLIKRPPPFLKFMIRRILPAKKWRHALMYFFYQRNIAVQPREALNPELYQQLVKRFIPEVEQLEKILNRNLSRWKQ